MAIRDVDPHSAHPGCTHRGHAATAAADPDEGSHRRIAGQLPGDRRRSPSRLNPYNHNGGPDLDLAFMGYPNLVINGCDTGTPDLVLPGDTTFGQAVRQCAEAAGDDAAFVACVADFAGEWQRRGLIALDQMGSVVRCAEKTRLPLDTPVPTVAPSATATATATLTPPTDPGPPEPATEPPRALGQKVWLPWVRR